MITSGLKRRMSFAPSLAHAIVGSGVTSKNSTCVISSLSSSFVTAFDMPLVYKYSSVTTIAPFAAVFLLQFLQREAKAPRLKYTFSGARNQSMFSLLSATVLILMS